MIRRPGHQTGLTMIEVLIALAIASGLVAVLTLSLQVAFRARRSAFQGNQEARSARFALEAVGRDLTAALTPNGVLAGSFIGENASSDATHRLDQVTFFNTADPLRPSAASGDVQEVALLVISSSELQRDPALPSLAQDSSNDSASSASGLLVRRVRRQLLNPVKQTPVDQVLADGVISFSLTYYDGSSWSDSWDSTAKNNTLPRAVQVSLTLAGASSEQGQASLTRLFLLSSSDFSSSSSTGSGISALIRWPLQGDLP